MDEARFDRLTKLLAVAPNRRRLLAALAGGGLVSAFGSVAWAQPDPTCRSAGTRCRRDADCCSARCRTTDGRRSCGCSRIARANEPGGLCNRAADCCNEAAICLRDPRPGALGVCCVPEGDACGSARQCCGIFACTNGICGG